MNSHEGSNSGRQKRPKVSHNCQRPDDIEPLLVRPRVAWKMLGCGNTRGYELLAANELDSFLDGRSRKITVESIRRYVARNLTPGDTGAPPRHRKRGEPDKNSDSGFLP